MPGPKKWQNRMRGHGSRWTAPRKAIVDLLSRTKQHMSAKDIYNALVRIYPGIGLTTIYRTLDLLEKMKLLKKISLATGENKYELIHNRDDHHHHHLICTNCGKIIDYDDFVDEELQLIKKTENTLSKKHNFVINDHNIEFYGICEQCREGGE